MIVPDAHGDWLNQRDYSYSKFIRTDGKKTTEKAIFSNYSRGLATARDAWVYGSSRDRIKDNVDRMFATYNQQAKEFDSDSSNFEFIRDDKLIHWNRTLENFFKRGVRNLSFEHNSLFRSIYRPFYPQYCYFNKYANDMTYQIPLLFPSNEMENLAICSSGVDNRIICVNQNAKDAGQIALMTNHIADAWVVGMNTEKLKSLSEEEQQALAKAATECQQWYVDYQAKRDGEMLKLLTDNGMQANEVSAEGMAKFVDVSKSLYPEFKKLVGNDAVFDAAVKFCGK